MPVKNIELIVRHGILHDMKESYIEICTTPKHTTHTEAIIITSVPPTLSIKRKKKCRENTKAHPPPPLPYIRDELYSSLSPHPPPSLPSLPPLPQPLLLLCTPISVPKAMEAPNPLQSEDKSTNPTSTSRIRSKCRQ